MKETHPIKIPQKLPNGEFKNRIYPKTKKSPNKVAQLLRPWLTDMPMAATWEGWGEWKFQSEQRHPFRWLLFRKLPDKINLIYHRFVYRPLDNFKWNLIWRFHPKHQYYIIKPRSLKPGYYDSNTRIQHACMDELSEYVEWNEKGGHIDWNGTPGHKKAWAEMKIIYKWWNKDRKALEKQIDRLTKKWYDENKKRKSLFSSKLPAKEKKNFQQTRKHEKLLETTDTEMLIRLMKVLPYMWT